MSRALTLRTEHDRPRFASCTWNILLGFVGILRRKLLDDLLGNRSELRPADDQYHDDYLDPAVNTPLCQREALQ